MSKHTVAQSQSFREYIAEATNQLIAEAHERQAKQAAWLAFATEGERLRLTEEQRIDRAQIDMEDAAENERQVKELERWIAEQKRIKVMPIARLREKGGRW